MDSESNLSYRAPSKTKASCSVPQEITDLIIDHLHDEPTTLKACCLVSKAWIQRTRRYLFVNIKFHPLGRRVGRWRITFPDRTNSPAHHTRTLSICHPQLITAADVNTLLTFCGVVRLDVDTDLFNDQRVSLVPLHGFSPVLRSLHLTFTSLPNPEILNLICSFPILEDLALVSRSRRHSDIGWNAPLTSPRLTGSLELRLIEGIQSITDRLFCLPNGFNFTKITVPWLSQGDVSSTVRLVSRCSGTLGSLDISNHLSDVSGVPSLDLSKATRLQDIVFRCKSSNIQWITTTLHTVEPQNIQQISLESPRYIPWREIQQEWFDLDTLLVQFWTSHSLRLKVMYESRREWEDRAEDIARLLPEVMRRGIADLVECPCVEQQFPSFIPTLI